MLAQVVPLPTRVNVEDLSFDRVTMRQAVRRIVRMAKRRDRARYVCTGNLDHLVIAGRDLEFRAAHKKADLVVADGAPVVWLSRIVACEPLPERVAGSDLFWEIGRVSGEANLRVFFLGGAPGSAAKAAAVTERRHPCAMIAGTYCPPQETFHTEEEQAKIRRIVRLAAPDILLVGFGAPKQEKWIAANKDRLGVPVSIGVGGSFEFAGGVLRRAPVWIQRTGFEWLFRFAQEPDRLFRRYFIDDLPYLVGAAARAFAHRLRHPKRLFG